jgi:hypothetical protein
MRDGIDVGEHGAKAACKIALILARKVKGVVITSLPSSSLAASMLTVQGRRA